ncbi:MAG: PAS domain S-box protein [Rhodocyclaceae bacterium]|nr:PAS domain S-box protein [Rhodocyclaceae bacterium]
MGSNSTTGEGLPRDEARDWPWELREAQRLAGVGSWHWDAATDVTVGSDELLSLFGLEPDARALPDFKDQRGSCYPVEDWEVLNAAVQHAIASGEGYELVLQAFRRGSPIWVVTRGEVVHDRNGQVCGLRGTIQDITGQKQSEMSAERQRHLYQSVFEQAAVGIARVSPEGRWLEVNQRLCEIVGYSREELLALDFQRLTHPEDLDADLHYVGQMLAGDIGRYQMEKRYFHRDGQIVWVRLTVALVHEVDGAPAYFISVVEDVSERVGFELDLIRQQVMYRSVFEQAAVGIARVAPDGRWLDANKRLCEIVGYDYATLLKTDFQQITHPDDLATDLEFVRQLLAGERDHYRMEKRYLHRAGHAVWIRLTVSLVRDGRGSPEYFIAVVEDVSERRAMEDELQQSRRRLQLLIDHAPVALAMFDRDMRYVAASRRWCDDYGLSGTDLLGRGHYEIFPDIPESWKAAHQRGMAGEVLKVDEDCWLRADGSAQWLRWELMPWRTRTDEVGGVVIFTEDISARKRNEALILHLSHHDPLTGLPNRSLLVDRLEQALSAARRHTRFGAVLFLNLHHFKSVNDIYGHVAGDALLKLTAERLTQHLRQSDSVARLGGDEFVILLPELGSEPEQAASLALAVAEKMRNAIAAPSFIGAQELQATVSIGITLFPVLGEAAEDVVREADMAMHRAKDLGSPAPVFFEPEMQSRISERYALEKALRRALHNGGLALHAQSQVDAGGAVLSAEMLIRWHHPELGLVAPARFIPLAEECGLIIPIGEWVLRETCRELVRLGAAGRRLNLAVNVSPHQFHQADFGDRVRRILQETGADPDDLTLEITENLLLNRTDEVIARIHDLASLGIRFSIDDFGTGYSSLAYLKRLPLHELKIDRSFVDQLPHDANDVALCKAILAMADQLAIDVVAEGVENRAQVDFLAQHGCNRFQGYVFHLPEPLADWRRSLLAPGG